MKRVSRPRLLGSLGRRHRPRRAAARPRHPPGEGPSLAGARAGAHSAAEAIAEEAWLGVRWQSLLPGMMK
ncbi:MAG: hypothetical protein RML12_02190 [Xanthomonadales bacterium]|nr:hypothetical protein [Xanthomonadales bacterium]